MSFLWAAPVCKTKFEDQDYVILLNKTNNISDRDVVHSLPCSCCTSPAPPSPTCPGCRRRRPGQWGEYNLQQRCYCEAAVDVTMTVYIFSPRLSWWVLLGSGVESSPWGLSTSSWSWSRCSSSHQKKQTKVRNSYMLVSVLKTLMNQRIK